MDPKPQKPHSTIVDEAEQMKTSLSPREESVELRMALWHDGAYEPQLSRSCTHARTHFRITSKGAWKLLG